MIASLKPQILNRYFEPSGVLNHKGTSHLSSREENVISLPESAPRKLNSFTLVKEHIHEYDVKELHQPLVRPNCVFCIVRIIFIPIMLCIILFGLSITKMVYRSKSQY